MEILFCYWYCKINLKWKNIIDLNVKVVGEVICKKCKETYIFYCGCNNFFGFYYLNIFYLKFYKYYRFDC